MPRYYFDTDDSNDLIRDERGLDLANIAAARREALDVLPDLARENMPGGDKLRFSSTVRDEAGAVLYKATLSLDGEWCVIAPPE